MTRLLIADDHPLVLKGIEGMFDRTEFEIAAVCTDGAQALARIREGVCDIAVVDLHMPGHSGLEILRAVRSEGLPVKIVLLTATVNDASLVEAIHGNVDGLVLKESAASLLITCLTSVRNGEPWIDRVAMTRALNALAPARPTARLTERESEIARAVAGGLRNKEIAARAGISEGTVKMHLHNIYEKLGLGTRTELALYVRDTTPATEASL
jgi:two-component system nitrate/nitrite response regulator NarP